MLHTNNGKWLVVGNNVCTTNKPVWENYQSKCWATIQWGHCNNQVRHNGQMWEYSVWCVCVWQGNGNK